MAVVCDRSSVPVAERAECWAAASTETFVPLECRPHDPASLHGLLEAGLLGELALPAHVRAFPAGARGCVGRAPREQLGIRVAVEVLDQGAVPRSAGKAVRVVDRR